MRIEQLEYLAAVTRHGSLRQASERLHLSQPALSEALSKLERELGVTLLDRRRSGARISRQGQELLPTMVEVLEAVDRLRQAAGDPTLSLRMLRVGTVNAGTSAVLVPADARLPRGTPGDPGRDGQHPARRRSTRDWSRAALDLGLVNVLPGRRRTPGPARRSSCCTGGRSCAAAPTTRSRSWTTVELDELADEPFVAMRAGYLMHRYAHRLFGGTLPATASPPTAPRWAS